MLFRLLTIIVLPIALALPASAQKLTEQDARTVFEKVIAAYDKAYRDYDPAEIAANYAEDAIRLNPAGPVRGRAAVEKWYADLLGSKSWAEDPIKTDQVKVISDDVILATGSWSGTWKDAKGTTPMNGFYSLALVRENGTWTIGMSTVNVTPHN